MVAPPAAAATHRTGSRARRVTAWPARCCSSASRSRWASPSPADAYTPANPLRRYGAVRQRPTSPTWRSGTSRATSPASISTCRRPRRRAGGRPRPGRRRRHRCRSSRPRGGAFRFRRDAERSPPPATVSARASTRTSEPASRGDGRVRGGGAADRRGPVGVAGAAAGPRPGARDAGRRGVGRALAGARIWRSRRRASRSGSRAPAADAARARGGVGGHRRGAAARRRRRRAAALPARASTPTGPRARRWIVGGAAPAARAARAAGRRPPEPAAPSALACRGRITLNSVIVTSNGVTITSTTVMATENPFVYGEIVPARGVRQSRGRARAADHRSRRRPEGVPDLAAPLRQVVAGPPGAGGAGAAADADARDDGQQLQLLRRLPRGLRPRAGRRSRRGSSGRGRGCASCSPRSGRRCASRRSRAAPARWRCRSRRCARRATPAASPRRCSRCRAGSPSGWAAGW